MKKADFIIILTALAIGLIMLIHSYSGRDGAIVQIYVNGNLYGQYNLDADEDIVIDSDGCHNLVSIEDGAVFMKEASCPNKVCVSQGRIENQGQVICCAPNQIIIVISEDKEASYDAYTN